MVRVKHMDEHPQLDVPGCFACRIAGVQMAPSAMPSRRGGAHAVESNALEAAWSQDMPAYKRLRREGLQPKNVNGSAELERKANTRIEVEHGIHSPPAVAERAGVLHGVGAG